MSPYVARIAERLWEAEQELPLEVKAQERRWQGSVVGLLTSPIIYSLLLPLALLDLWVTLYQWVCFPIYRIARVPRRAYFVIDRHKLTYLNGIERINCTFCSYATGLFAYVLEVAACTEQYWCPIKHARQIRRPHERYHRFVDYGDAEGYRRDLAAVRRALNRPARAPDRRSRKQSKG